MLFVIDSLGSGGAQRQMVNLAIGLHKRAHQIEFFVYHPEFKHFVGELEQSGIAIHQYKKTTRLSLGVIWQLRQQIIRGKYDIVLAFLDTPNFYTEVVSAGLSKPVIVVSERFVYPTGKLPIRKWLLQQCHRLADQITVNSHHQSERMKHAFPWMRTKMTVIYNGIDSQKFSPAPESLTKQTEIWHLLVVGSIISRKNVTGLIKALAYYQTQYGTKLRISWAGQRVRSKEGEKIYTDALKLLDQLQVSHAWEWLGECDNIPELLHHYDALIHPSFYEGLPNAICEALATGLPVLASNVGDHARLIQDGITGFLFDPNIPENMAETIHQFISLNSDERLAMGNRARQFAEQELAMDTYITHYEDLFLNLLKTRDQSQVLAFTA